MNEEFGPDFITVTDEDGNDIELELLDALEHNGQTYMAFFPAVPEGADEDNFAPVRAFYEGLVQRMGWKSLGIVCAGGNMAAGDIQNHPEQLQEAEELKRLIDESKGGDA